MLLSTIVSNVSNKSFAFFPFLCVWTQLTYADKALTWIGPSCERCFVKEQRRQHIEKEKSVNPTTTEQTCGKCCQNPFTAYKHWSRLSWSFFTINPAKASSSDSTSWWRHKSVAKVEWSLDFIKPASFWRRKPFSFVVHSENHDFQEEISAAFSTDHLCKTSSHVSFPLKGVGVTGIAFVLRQLESSGTNCDQERGGGIQDNFCPRITRVSRTNCARGGDNQDNFCPETTLVSGTTWGVWDQLWPDGGRGGVTGTTFSIQTSNVPLTPETGKNMPHHGKTNISASLCWVCILVPQWGEGLFGHPFTCPDSAAARSPHTHILHFQCETL